MDESELLQTVRAETKTELSRLGSSKSLYADTNGEMEPDAVLRAAAANAGGAADVFERWAETADTEETFARAGERARDHSEQLREKLAEAGGETPAAVAALEGRDRLPERLGALVGWTLVTEQKASQSTGFFTGQADPGTASLFREFGDDYEAIREDALEAVASACETDEAYERATESAVAVVEAAYGAYFETLEELGVNPKPVC